MMKIVTFKWNPNKEYRSSFDSKAVNVLYNMVKRNVADDFKYEFICITDDDGGINPEIKTIPLWENPQPNFGDLNKPNCFYRLRAFSEEMINVIGERFCWLDLDCVITGDITPLLERKEDFVINRGTNIRTPYNGSMVLMNAGCRRQVWHEFNPQKSPLLAKQKGYIGSDQAWIGACLGRNESRFINKEGVFSFQNDILTNYEGQLPEIARIVFFQGKSNPWDASLQAAFPWVKEHYR